LTLSLFADALAKNPNHTQCSYSGGDVRPFQPFNLREYPPLSTESFRFLSLFDMVLNFFDPLFLPCSRVAPPCKVSPNQMFTFISLSQVSRYLDMHLDSPGLSPPGLHRAERPINSTSLVYSFPPLFFLLLRVAFFRSNSLLEVVQVSTRFPPIDSFPPALLPPMLT